MATDVIDGVGQDSHPRIQIDILLPGHVRVVLVGDRWKPLFCMDIHVYSKLEEYMMTSPDQ